MTDHEEKAFHVGAYYIGRLISIASFIIETKTEFPYKKQYRLRQMATLDEFRRKLGADRGVVDYAETIIKDRGYDFLWCKGRTTVQKYCEKLGFQAHGDVFDYPPIGHHILMFKKLS